MNKPSIVTVTELHPVPMHYPWYHGPIHHSSYQQTWQKIYCNTLPNGSYHYHVASGDYFSNIYMFLFCIITLSFNVGIHADGLALATHE